jgi:UPF0716 protein FxsA
MFGYLVFLFTIVPALEFYLLYSIGGQIGAGNTFLIIIITGIVGASLAKSQGLSIIQKVQSELAQGQVPGKQLAHGFLVFGGGLLLLTPGFLTDILGFSMVIPGSRHVIVAFLSQYVTSGIAKGTMKFSSMNSKGGNAFYYSSQSSNSQNPMQENPFQKPNEIDSNIIEADYTKKKD